VTLPERNLGPPEQTEGAPAENDTPPESTPSDDHLIRSVRQPIARHSRGKFLFDQHRRELEIESAIHPDVIAERGYESIHRPTSGDQRQRQRLTRLKIPPFATRENYYFPGMLIPVFGPTGAKASYQWKPRYPVPDHDGKRQKYISPRGQKSRLDVHPRNRNTIADLTVELWITEGIKKGDSLTSQGLCASSLTGVFNWRSTLGTLGDWEDVPLKGRVVTICFDADARTKPNVSRAMIRLGRWLKSKAVKKIWYLIVPAEVNGKPVKGVDDFFAGGGTLEALKAARTTKAPNPDVTDDTFSDARLAETIADDVLADQFMWVSGLGWLLWDGRQWVETSDAQPIEAVRQYALDQFTEALEPAKRSRRQGGDRWLATVPQSRKDARRSSTSLAASSSVRQPNLITILT
jgi:hypothetical protein